jgi:CMP-N-acetylneuraminic acid synthetase
MYDLAVVLPVRRGSSRVADKSMLPFGDAGSLIEWKLRQLREVIDPARIYVSSEDDEFLEIARGHGCSLHKRDLRLATGHIVPFSEVVSGVVCDIPHEHIAWCTVVCPLMAPREYLEAFRRYHDDVILGDLHDSLVGVNRLQEYFWMNGKSLNYHASREHVSSQDLTPLHKLTNSIYMLRRETALERAYHTGERPVLHELSRLAGIDIDHMIDYRMARALHAIYEEDGLGAVDPATRIDWSAPIAPSAVAA